MTASPLRSEAEDARATMIGPVGHAVIANIEQLRKARGWSFRDLANRMAELGRPVGDTVLHRQSTGKRRIDSDDLVAFAAAFSVTPAELLRDPAAGIPGDDHPAAREALALAERVRNLVAAAGEPGNATRARAQVDRAMRRVQLEVEELLDDMPGYDWGTPIPCPT